MSAALCALHESVKQDPLPYKKSDPELHQHSQAGMPSMSQAIHAQQ